MISESTLISSIVQILSERQDFNTAAKTTFSFQLQMAHDALFGRAIKIQSK